MRGRIGVLLLMSVRNVSAVAQLVVDNLSLLQVKALVGVAHRS